MESLAAWFWLDWRKGDTMNNVCLSGRLTKDPIVHDGATKVARYTLAVKRRGDESDFISCVTFSGGADFAEKYLKKGIKINVVGRLQTGRYEKDGRTVYTTDVVVQEHEFCERKREESTDDFMPADDDLGDLFK